MVFFKTKTSPTMVERTTTLSPVRNNFKWPGPSARPRKGTGPQDMLMSIVSIFLGLLIVVYIILLIACHGKPIKDMPGIVNFLDQFSSLSPTAMPIIFAFVVGRAIKTLAHWRLQQGERVGKLDLLYGSTTVIGTVSTMFDTCEFGLLSAFLVVTWALSPLGAQGALRVLSFRDGSTYSFKNMSYFSMNTSFPTRFMTSDLRTLGLPVHALVLSSIGAPNTTRMSSLDTWGNVKVPVLELLPGYKGMQSKEWIAVQETTNSSNLTFSSLIGIPVASIPSDGNSSFSLETSYLDLDCSHVYKVPTDDMLKMRKSLKSKLTDCEGSSQLAPCTQETSWGQIATEAYPDGFSSSSALRCSDPRPQAREIYYVGYDFNGNGTYAQCSMTTTYVEMKVKCVAQGCVATAMRPSTKDNPSQNHTVFDAPCWMMRYTFSYFIGLFNTLDASGSSQAASLLQAYLVDPDNALSIAASMERSSPGVYTVEKSVLSRRFAQFLTTYWIAMTATHAVFQGHASNYTDLISGVFTGDRIIQTSGSNGTIYTPVTRLHCDFGWMTPLVLSTIIMLCAAVLAMVVDLELRVPKMLMNMTTLTRGNPEHYGLPPGGGWLRDETRGKLIRDMKVRFGSMEGHETHDHQTGLCYEEGGDVRMVDRRRNVTKTEEESSRPFVSPRPSSAQETSNMSHPSSITAMPRSPDTSTSALDSSPPRLTTPPALDNEIPIQFRTSQS